VPAIDKIARGARYTLGSIRIVNGALGLLAPRVIQKRLGDQAPERNAAAIYGLRLFGVRTVLIGLDLFHLPDVALDGALRSAVIIHASDTATVLTLRRRKVLSRELARPLTLISGLNTALAVIAFLTHRRSGS
jgi:hypothetical protein